jgi:multidrug resistance efflux pump
MKEIQTRIDIAHPSRFPSADDSPLQASRPAAVKKKEGKWRSRLTRWTIGGVLLAVAGWLAVPTVLFRTSVRATVTAPLVDVRIPLQGLVCGTPPLVGATVTAGEKLFEVQADAPDRRPSERIRGEIESIRRNAAALKAQIADLDKLKITLNMHFDEYKSDRIAQAEKHVAEQDARINETASRLKTADFEHRMHLRLRTKAGSSEFELARAEQAVEGVRNELEVARHAAARLQLQLAAAHRGFFVGESDGGQERVASKQRVDEIEIQQAGLRAKLGELEGKLYELNARLESEDHYLADHQRLSVIAPISGVVWSSTLVPGSEVACGSIALEILDPVPLAIEATFNKADAERVCPGECVKARLIGSSQILSGHVVRVAGSGTIDPESVEVAARVPTSPDTFRVIIKLNEQPKGGNPANQYYVGRSAVVWMPHNRLSLTVEGSNEGRRE